MSTLDWLEKGYGELLGSCETWFEKRVLLEAGVRDEDFVDMLAHKPDVRM